MKYIRIVVVLFIILFLGFVAFCIASYQEPENDVYVESFVIETGEAESRDFETTRPSLGIEAGDVIQLGVYQDEPIEWVVLYVDDNGRLLVISKEILFVMPYNSEDADVTWENCSLRLWLNNEFYSEAFSDEERNQILQTCVFNVDNEEYGTDGGSDTFDNVFLLSIDEAESYGVLTGDINNRLILSNGTTLRTFEGWWLRSPGQYSDCAACVNANAGTTGAGIMVYGLPVDHEFGVHPAMWIRIDESLLVN